MTGCATLPSALAQCPESRIDLRSTVWGQVPPECRPAFLGMLPDRLLIDPGGVETGKQLGVRHADVLTTMIAVDFLGMLVEPFDVSSMALHRRQIPSALFGRALDICQDRGGRPGSA